MRWLVDGVYLVVVLLTMPIWLFRMIRTGKIRTDWPARFGRVGATARRGDSERPRVLLHAVSVGEVNAIRGLVATLDAMGVDVVIATTTDTGTQRACSLFDQRHHVVRFPFDFSWMIKRFLGRLRPDLVVLVELEVWPNFLGACNRSSTPVMVINGRLTARSRRRYGIIGPLVHGTFRRLAWVGAQDEQYAERFRELGVLPDRLEIVGNMKWDNARCAEGVDGSESLRLDLGIDPERPLIVAGSTAPGEHELIRDVLPPGCQLLCVPRKPEWFDEAAAALPGCTRRSTGRRGSSADYFLLDTIGELSKAYDLADVAIVGRSFVDLHGSDVTEPIGLGVATVVGPEVEDFRLMVDALVTGGGLCQVTRETLSSVVSELLGDEQRRQHMARRGRAVILQQQGATAAYADRIMSMVNPSPE
jgi:3-deoxy-D-manno-octulosonic-acid transferase